MKPTRIVILLTLALAQCVLASGPPVIKISTSESGASYRMEDYNARTESDTRHLPEVEVWVRNFSEKSPGDLFMIYPDERTTFRTVAGLVLRLKAAGVENFALVHVEATDKEQITHSIVSKTDKILTSRVSRAATGRPTP